MSRNQALLDVLNSEEFLKHKDAGAVLRRLLAVGSEPVAFNQAFRSEKSFFNGLIPGVLVLTDNDSENTIAVDGEGTENSISDLRQKMIELLVIPVLPQEPTDYLQHIAGPIGWKDLLKSEETKRFFNGITDVEALLNNPKTNQKIVNAANEILSQRYYLKEIQKENDEQHLIQIATKNNLNELKKVLPEDKTKDKEHLNAVSEKIAPALREAAATKVLRTKIATCSKPEVLTQLAAARNLQELKVVLENHAELGFKESTDAHKAVDLRNAFSSNEALDVIQALATVFQRITSLDKKTIEDYRYDVALYNGFLPELLEKVLTKETITSINQAVLYHYLYSELTNISDENLKNISDGDFSLLHFASDIYQGNKEVQDQLMGIAAAALLIREANTKNYPTLSNEINTPYQESLNNHQEKIDKLAPDSIHEFQLERFLILISKAESQQIPHLTALNAAATMDDFKRTLDSTGLDKVKDWIRPDDLAQVKQAIANRLSHLVNQQITDAIESVSSFAKESHPALLSMLASLPPAQRDAVLADPQKIAALMHARNKNQVDLLLGTVGTALVQPLIDENTKLEPYRGIANAEIARHLALISGLSPLNELQIQSINRAITEANFDDVDGLINCIDRLAFFGFENSTLRRQFGIGDKGAFIVKENGEDLLEKIQKQQTNNERAMSDPENQYILNRLLGTAKTEQLTPGETAQIITDIDNAQKATDILNRVPPRAYLKKFPNNGANFFTDDLLAADKKLKHLATLENQKDYKYSLDSIKERINNAYTVFTRLSKADSKIRKKSEELTRYDSSKLFDPAFGHLFVDGNASDLAHLREWARNCERIIEQELGLQVMIEDAITLLDSVLVPDQSSAQAKAIREERRDLAKKLEKVNQNVVLYQNTIKLLNGDPDEANPNLKKGLISFYEAQSQKLTSEKKNRSLIYFSDDYKDYPIAEKEKRIKDPLDTTQKPVTTVQPNMTIGMDPQSQKTAYHIANPIAPGHFREHSVRSFQGKEIGRVVEERDVNDLTPMKGTKESLTFARVSAKGFPAQVDLQAPGTVEAAIRLSMKQAQIILNNLPDNYPSKNSPPIVITGNAQQAQFMWTALMILIEDRKLKIPASHVKINPNCSFDPGSQYTLGRATLGFNKDSAYKKVFNSCRVIVDQYKLPTKTLETEKVNASKFFKEVLSASKENQAVKDEINTIIPNPGSP